VILATVSSDAGFRRDVHSALDAHLRVEGAWDLSYEEISRLRGIEAGQKVIVIIDFSDFVRAMPAARAVDGRPLIAAIAVGAGSTRDEVVRLMQVGVRDVLPHFTFREILQAANRAAASLGCAGELIADLYAFVPAKPGCGASTVATYTTAMVASGVEEPVLLLDFDIRLGVTSFLLKAEGGKTIVDALMYAGRLDDDLWASLVCQLGNLHLLGSGPVDFSSPVAPESFSELLDYAVRRYSTVAVDLPGSMEQFESEVLMRAKHIFLVCTPDVGALHVARRKSGWLRDLRLTDKVSLVLNSLERRSAFSVGEIERIIQLPVRYQLPPSSKELARAAENGAILAGSSPLAKQLGSIADAMTSSRSVVKKNNPVRRFVEYFSISAARKPEESS
jgi:Flp pilus assembly CpaE family ATPase